VSDPYRTAGRDATEADRVEPAPVTPPMSMPRPMTERMIAAHKQAHFRSRGCRYSLCFVLSNPAAADFETEHIDIAVYERAMEAMVADPNITIRPRKGCRYIGSLRGVPVFVDPEMLGGWTAEMEFA
jgi:hypothetical protein